MKKFGNINHKEAGVAIFIKTEVDFKTRSASCDRRTLHNDKSITSWREHNKSKYICTWQSTIIVGDLALAS